MVFQKNYNNDKNEYKVFVIFLNSPYSLSNCSFQDTLCFTFLKEEDGINNSAILKISSFLK